MQKFSEKGAQLSLAPSLDHAPFNIPNLKMTSMPMSATRIENAGYA